MDGDPLGALRGGRYAIVGPLGAGSQGRTFDGVDKREGRPVAIKRFDVGRARSWKDVELAEREARVLQSLSHPQLPRYVEHFEENGALYLVMEKVQGESLAALRRRGATLDEREVWRLLADASRVLDYLHGRAPAVVHRDLKPGNIVRRPDGSFAFVDFGAVRDKLRPEGGSTVVGTFGYMAPEQFQGRALPVSDVYAVGATALTMLTGREPEDLPHRGLAIDVRAALRGRADERLAGAIERMLDPDPDRRAARIAPLLEPGKAPAARARPAQDDRFERKARAFERRAQEYQRRAARGGPGAQGWAAGAESFLHAAQRFRDVSAQVREAADRRDARRERRRARRLERRARRHARAEHRLPFALSLLLAAGLTLGMIAVRTATRLIVPLALLALSLVLGRRLAEAARAVRGAGRSALGAMRRSRQAVLGRAVEGDGHASPPLRVERPPEQSDPSRVRVVDESASDSASDDGSEEERAAGEHVGRR